MEHTAGTGQVALEKRSGEITSSPSDANPRTTESTEKNVDKEPEYPTGLPLAFIILGLCLAVFVVALDNTIIATAIPKITDRFDSLNDVGWYASAYLLTTGAFQLLFGRFYSNFSIKWVFITSIAIFEFGSLICAATPTSIGLIVGRAIAGVGCAGIFSGALIILSQIVPLRSRPTYMGLIGGMYGIASVCGPLLGGVFTDKITWRLCFYINLPIGLITVIAIIFLYKELQRPAVDSIGWVARLKTFDPTGNLFLMPAIISLFLALQWGGTKYAWGNARIIALMVVFGVLIVGFIAIQFINPENAMVPPLLIRQRSIWAACAFNFCMAGTFFILSYYLPIWFQAVKGVTALRSGIMNLPLILGVVFASMIAGGGTTALGYYTPWMLVSAVVMSIGCGMLTTFTINTGSPAWIGWQAMAGLGIGLGMQLPLIAVQTVLPTDEIPIGTALVVFAQTLGGAIFVCIGQTIFTNKLLHYCALYAPQVDPAVILGIGATRIHTVFEGMC
ncbi:major facilitator superfamily domain-containing protein [Rhexocercosporidium sp. MPI-PUGE-AT-0058]|nr:major facilitator superfamily domain-containing protein [Rhexocercosporidium sp. MPI-PUGE-AT-0058]